MRRGEGRTEAENEARAAIIDVDDIVRQFRKTLLVGEKLGKLSRHSKGGAGRRARRQFDRNLKLRSRGCWEQLRGNEGEQPNCGDQQRPHGRRHGERPVHDQAHPFSVPSPNSGQPARRVLGGVVPPREPQGQQRCHRQGQEQRKHEGDGQYDREATHVLRRLAVPDGEGRKGDDDGEAGGQEGRRQGAPGLDSGLFGLMAKPQAALIVLDNDDAVIDEQAKGDDQGGNRNHVQLDAEQAHQDERAHDR